MSKYIKFFIVLLIEISFSFNVQAQENEEVNNAELQNIDTTQDPSNFYNIAVVQALNKITAKTSVLEMKIGNKIEFGKITIIAHKCWKSSSDKRPESKILLEVSENSLDEEKDKSKNKPIFYGWMISTSPSISDLEHPIYDITAITCKK